MNIVCLVKCVPNTDNFKYDYENNVLVRENVSMILNPDDAAALAYALILKEKFDNVSIEIVTMAPLSAINHIRDLLRRKADKAAIISDKLYVGSDTYVTSRIISEYLKTIKYDVILSGTKTLDGDTSHVPAQIAELLSVNHMANIKKIEEINFLDGRAVIETECENYIQKYEVKLPAILSISKDSGYKLPFIKYADLNLDVDDKIKIITNEQLGFKNDETGLKGSPTIVAKAFTKLLDERNSIFAKADDEGVDLVYEFLKEKGFIQNV